MTSTDTGSPGQYFLFRKCYSHLSEIKSDDFFSSSGPDQSNRSPLSLIPIWASKGKTTQAERLYPGTGQVTVTGWQVIVKPVVPDCGCVCLQVVVSSNNGRIIVTFSQIWIRLYKKDLIFQSKRTNESYSQSELCCRLDLLLKFQPSFKPFGILSQNIFSPVEYWPEGVGVLPLKLYQNNDLILKCSFLFPLLWFNGVGIKFEHFSMCSFCHMLKWPFARC